MLAIYFHFASALIFAFFPYVSGESSTPCAGSDSSTPLLGYSDWELLKKDVEGGTGGTYTLCPSTTLRVGSPSEGGDEWIEVPALKSPLVIRCGASGSPGESCTISGGTRHFWFTHKGKTIMRGITMTGSTDGSVKSENDANPDITFEDCTWRDNVASGKWPGACARIGRGTHVHYKGCSFVRNKGRLGALSNNGVMTVERCHFVENENTCDGCWASAISNGGFEGVLFMVSSCFVRNHARGLGTVFLTHASDGYSDGNNYGEGNIVDAEDPEIGYPCTGSFRQEGTGDDMWDMWWVLKGCFEFMSPVCRAAGVRSSANRQAARANISLLAKYCGVLSFWLGKLYLD